jgi:hypothetical protein
MRERRRRLDKMELPATSQFPLNNSPRTRYILPLSITLK